MQYRSPGSGEASGGLRLSHFRHHAHIASAVAAAGSRRRISKGCLGSICKLGHCCHAAAWRGMCGACRMAWTSWERRHLRPCGPPIYGAPPSAALRGLGGIGCPAHGAPSARVSSCAPSLPRTCLRVCVCLRALMSRAGVSRGCERPWCVCAPVRVCVSARPAAQECTRANPSAHARTRAAH